MTISVYVDGQEGTTGLRIHEYLAQRRDVEVLRIDPDRRKDPAERRRCLNDADVAFLCLPDDAAREAASWVGNPNTCVIDASTAHRTADGWIYGLPELAPGQRRALRETKRIANPGCHATAFVLLVRPLVDAGLLRSDAALAGTSITGYSGGGKKMIADYESPERKAKRALASPTSEDDRLASPRPYALALAHKHLPEMTMHAGLSEAPIFVPVVGDFYRGLAVTIPLHLRDLGTTAEALHAALAERYAGERFVRVLPLRDPETLAEGGGFFDVQACNGTNRADLFVFGNDRQALLIARIDNLGKGASGAAVQSMNAHLGIDEATGL